MVHNIQVRGKVEDEISVISIDFGNDYEITETYEKLPDGNYSRKSQIDHKGTPEKNCFSDTVVPKEYVDKLRDIIN